MRVVSLCPSSTETVFDLGAGDTLVGVTKFCVHPAERVRSIEKVGGTKNPKIPRIVELAPDLVLMNEEENRRADAEALADAGVPLLVSFPKTVEETADAVRATGRALDCRPTADRVADAIDRRVTRLQASTAVPVRLAYLIWRRPWMTVARDTYVDALLSLVGGINVFADREPRYPEIQMDDLVRRAPDVVLLSSEPYPFGKQHADELARDAGIARDRIHLVDGEMLSWHGSRTPRGIDYAEDLLTRARSLGPARRR